MATPTPEEQAGQAFIEATAEAVQAATMALRLMVAIADAVRRRLQRKAGEKETLPPAEQAMNEIKAELKGLLPPDISVALMEAGDWPQMAQQLIALKHAGVDLEQLLPRFGEIAVTVRDEVAANAARVAREGTGKWERVLRETLPAGPAREAVLSSQTWPGVASAMARLDEMGVDVRKVLAFAHNEALGVGSAVAKGMAASEAPTVSRDAMLSYGPMTDGLDLPKDLDLEDRTRAFRQLAISPQENERFMRMVREAMPGREREVDLMVAAKQWPLVAARMAKMESEGKPVQEHLAGLMKDTSWDQGRGTQIGSRMVQAANHVLRHPPGEAPPVGRPKVSTSAARSQSSTVDPTKGQPTKGAASADPGVAAHREAGPVAKQGRAR